MRGDHAIRSDDVNDCGAVSNNVAAANKINEEDHDYMVHMFTGRTAHGGSGLTQNVSDASSGHVTAQKKGKQTKVLYLTCLHTLHTMCPRNSFPI